MFGFIKGYKTNKIHSKKSKHQFYLNNLCSFIYILVYLCFLKNESATLSMSTEKFFDEDIFPILAM